MTTKRDKVRHQVKSRFYYLFWGTATVAVVAGQVYVGTGYRSMSRSLDAWFEQTINIMIKKRIMQEAPRRQEYYRDDMVIR